MKRLLVVIALLFVLVIPTSLFAAGQSETAGDAEIWEDPNPDPFSPMPFPVTISTGRKVPPDGQNWPEGESITENDVADWAREKINVSAEVAWTTSDQGSAFADRVNILIASGSIPDILVLNVENDNGLSILRKLIDEDMIMDLTDVYETYASETYREAHEGANNAAVDVVSHDGRLYGLPDLADLETAIPFIWVRKDWLDRLGLEPPRTIEDVEQIATAFRDRDPDGNGEDDTMGLLGSSKLYRGDTNTFDWVFNAYGAYPGDWVEGTDGRAIYGSTSDAVQAALGTIRGWYESGLLDREFALKDPSAATEPIAANRAGIFQGAWWSAWWPLMSAIQNDPTADWRAYLIQGVDGEYNFRSYAPVKNFVVVRKDFAYPQAVMKVINHQTEAAFKRYEWFNALVTGEGKYNVNNIPDPWPVPGISAKYSDEISRRAREIVGIVEGTITESEATAEGWTIAQDVITGMQSGETGTGPWANYTNWMHAARQLGDNDVQQVIPVFSGVTETMVRQRVQLDDLETIAFLEMILGERPLSSFDEFVDQWKQLGGEQITTEVNEILGR